MSHVSGDSGKESEQEGKKRKFRGNEFGKSVANIAVAQICESKGFQSFQQSALDTLSDVAVRYIQELGKSAHFHANLSGRTDSNVLDVIQGLETLGSAQGFSGASDINHSLLSSGTIGDIRQFINVTEEIPPAFDIPQFPVVKHLKPIQSFLQIGKEPPGKHIPAWLPAFPDVQAFVDSPTHKENNHNEELEQERQDRKEELSVLNLRHRFANNGPGLPSAVTPGDPLKSKKAVESNPFLAAPLRFGEKEVSSIVHHDKVPNEAKFEYPLTTINRFIENHMSVLDTFAPAIEAMKSKSSDSGDGAQTNLLKQRPAVRFKIGIQEKPPTTDLILQRQDPQKVSSYFGNDIENDDKKRRAERILKKSMENSQELTQL